MGYDSWENPPEVPEWRRKEFEYEEQWYEYRDKHCICEYSDDCDCMSLEEFIMKQVNDALNYYDGWEEERTKKECI